LHLTIFDIANKFVSKKSQGLKMATTTVFLRKLQRSAMVYIIYRHGDKNKMYSTGVKIDPKNWIASKEKIDLTVGIRATKENESLIENLKKQSISYNAKINSVKSRLNDIATRFDLDSINPTVDRVNNEFYKDKKVKKTDLTQLKKEYLKSCKINKTPGTYRQIKTGLKTFTDFANGNNYHLSFDVFTLKLYDDYTAYLFAKELNNNTVGTRIKVLKTFLNWLKNHGYPINPEFEKYKVYKENPQIVYLNQKELDILKKKRFAKPHLRRTRDLFLFQCNTGLRISDLMRLDEEHIQDDIIQMRAYKTTNNIYIPLNPEAKRILKKYKRKLPKLADQVFNRQLKDMAKEAELNRKVEITDFRAGKKIFKKVPLHEIVKSHIARKTFISICVEKGIQPKVVCEMTGISVKVLIDHYYGTDKDNIIREMQKAFGLGNVNMQVS